MPAAQNLMARPFSRSARVISHVVIMHDVAQLDISRSRLRRHGGNGRSAGPVRAPSTCWHQWVVCLQEAWLASRAAQVPLARVSVCHGALNRVTCDTLQCHRKRVPLKDFIWKVMHEHSCPPPHGPRLRFFQDLVIALPRF